MFDSKLHQDLVKAYLDYFVLHEEWERRPSIRKYYKMRRQVKKIIEIGIERNKEVRKEYLSIKKIFAKPNNSRGKKDKQ